MCGLSLELLAFIVGDTWDGSVVARVLRDQGTFLKESSDVSEGVALGECSNLGHQLLLGNASERVADSR